MIKALMVAALALSSMLTLAQSDSSSLYLQKGLEEKTRGRRMESLKYFEKAHAYNKSSREILKELAEAYFDLRRYAQAKEKYRELEKSGDRSGSTYKQLMLLSYNMRHFEDAITYAGLLKKNDPSEKTAYFSGKSYYALEDLGNAIKHLEAAGKEDDKNADIFYTIARAYMDMQNYRQAAPHFQKALSLVPDNARWHYELALLYYAMTDDQNSLKHMILASEKGMKKDIEFQQNLATAYLNAGKFNEGIVTLHEILQKRPSDINVINSVAEAYYNNKKYNDAINYYDQLLAIDNRNADALYMIGMSYQKLGQKEKGMALCDKAIEMDPGLKSLKTEKKLPGMQ
jgi:tetratricopeptide (TPR) repeat protein